MIHGKITNDSWLPYKDICLMNMYYIIFAVYILDHSREIMIDCPPRFGTTSQNNVFSTLPSKLYMYT